MQTREEILKAERIGRMKLPESVNEEVLAAMDKFAIQQSCAFAEWADENYFRIGNSNKWCLFPGDEGGETWTTVELYNKYKNN